MFKELSVLATAMLASCTPPQVEEVIAEVVEEAIKAETGVDLPIEEAVEKLNGSAK